MLEQFTFTEQPQNMLLTAEDTERDIKETLKGISFMEDVRVIIKTKEKQQLSVNGEEYGPFEIENDMYPKNETIKITVENGQTIVSLKARHPGNYVISIKDPETITIHDKNMDLIRGYIHTTEGHFQLMEILTY